MNELSIRQGASLPLLITIKDDDAISATLYVKKTVDSPTYAITPKVGLFVDGEADVSLDESDTSIQVGDYIYQISVSYDTATEKYPEIGDCEIGDCEFPILRICDSLDSIGVS